MTTAHKKGLLSPAVRWSALVVFLLGGQIAMGVTAIVLSKSDPSVAVVPDYYQRAVKWDESKAAFAASKKLGWDVRVESTLDETRGLRVTMKDAEGQAIHVAQATFNLYPHARASQPRQWELHAAPETPSALALQPQDGTLELPGCFTQSGYWQVEFEVLDDQGRRFVYADEMVVL
ncbi:MAG: FixH family protein [Planctomycetota bacterium]